MRVLTPFPPEKIRYLNYGIFLFGASFLAWISIFKHYGFDSFLWDLGSHTQPLWEYMQGRIAHFPQSPPNYMLSDHFSISLILYSPFVLLFGSYTLLLIQWFFVLLGGWGIWQYIQRCAPSVLPYSPLILLFFFTHWGIGAALTYDFHNNVPAAMCIPWLVLFYREAKTRPFWITLIFMCLCQENIAFITAILLIGLILENSWKNRREIVKKGNKKTPWLSLFFSWLWKNKSHRLALWAIGFCAVYFISIAGFALPALHGKGILRYAHLGKNMPEIIAHIFTEPARIWETYQHANLEIKTRINFGFMIMLMGGIYLPFFKPWYLIPFFGYTAHRFLSDVRANMWYADLHYSIELSAFLTLVLIAILVDWKEEGAHKMKRIKIKTFCLFLLLGTSIYGTIRIAGIEGKLRRTFHLVTDPHYLQRPALMHAIALIPDHAKVLTQAHITPYLYKRNAGDLRALSPTSAQQEKGMDYLVFALVPALVENTPKEELEKIATYMESPDFELIFHEGDVFVFTRKSKS